MSSALKSIGKIAGPAASIAGAVTGQPWLSAIGTGISGFTGGASAPNVPGVSVYQPQNVGAADAATYGLIGENAANNPAQSKLGDFNTILNNRMNNPYADARVAGATEAGGALQNSGRGAIGTAGELNTSALAALPSARAVLEQAMDPQNALYDRTLQRLQDQIRVGQSARGITMSPYGADLENHGLSDFNLDWENNKLQRMTSGLSAYTGATTGAANTATSAANLSKFGAGEIASGAELPYGAYSANQSDDYTALMDYINAAEQANVPRSQAIAQYLQYMGLGTNAAVAAGNQANTQYQNSVTQAQNYATGLGQLTSNLPSINDISAAFDKYFGSKS